jgi:hypothetical protein
MIEEDGQIVSVALLTRAEEMLLGPAFSRLWPVEQTPCFGELLPAIDKADRIVHRERDEAAGAEVLIIPVAGS